MGATTVSVSRARIKAHDRCAFPQRNLYVKESTKNRVKGRVREISGKVKSRAGRATGNPRLQDRGDAENISGKVQRKIGEVGKVVGR